MLRRSYFTKKVIISCLAIILPVFLLASCQQASYYVRTKDGEVRRVKISSFGNDTSMGSFKARTSLGTEIEFTDYQRQVDQQTVEAVKDVSSDIISDTLSKLIQQGR